MFKDMPASAMCCDHWTDSNGGSGWSWTLVSLFGIFLDEAERRYGPRDKSYTPLGIEFGGDSPSIWYPGNRKHVSIKLSNNASKEPMRAVFQLAHETIHILSPSGGQNALVIEEGLATMYSHEMALKHGSTFCTEQSSTAYLDAEKDVVALLTQHPDAIKTARLAEPRMHQLIPDHFLTQHPDLDKELLLRLCSPFRTHKP